MQDPLSGLREDRARAREYGDANSELCWLATIDASGLPRVRALVLRDVEEGLALFINATSAKGADLTREPRCQIATWYPSLQRQWRLTVQTEPLSRTLLTSHWQRRPRSSQVMDHLYGDGFPQSTPLDDPARLRSAHDALDAALGSDPSPPADALALKLEILGAECLQIHPADRLHDRWEYVQDGSGWTRRALVP